MSAIEKTIRPDRVAIYIRWSTDDQTTGTTLETQREGCEFYVRSQGWQVRDDLIFIDDGYSGGSLDRPAMSKLRQRVKCGEVECVVVLKIDRLSRNIVDAVDLVLREWAGKCYLKSAREPIDTTTDLGRVIFNILATFADFERSQIRERTQGGKERRISEGKQMHAEPAFGYMRHPTEKGVWIENPAESPLVIRMFDLAAGGMSANMICRTLNAEGITTRSGKPWSVRAVLWILHNRTYIGEVKYGATSLKKLPASEQDGAGHKKTLRVYHNSPKVARKTNAVTPLVAAETFMLVQERLKQNQWERENTGSRAMSSPYLLVGLAKCPCGGALVHKVQMGKRNRERGAHYRHYICHRSRQGICTLTGHIRAEEAERLIEAEFLHLYGLKSVRDSLFTKRLGRVTHDYEAVATSHEAIRRQLAELDSQERDMLRDVRQGKLTPDEWRTIRASIEVDRSDLLDQSKRINARLSELESAKQAVAATFEALDAVDEWDKLEAWRKRQLLRMVLSDRITITKPKGTDELRIDAPWIR